MCKPKETSRQIFALELYDFVIHACCEYSVSTQPQELRTLSADEDLLRAWSAAEGPLCVRCSLIRSVSTRVTSSRNVVT